MHAESFQRVRVEEVFGYISASASVLGMYFRTCRFTFTGLWKFSERGGGGGGTEGERVHLSEGAEAIEDEQRAGPGCGHGEPQLLALAGDDHDILRQHAHEPNQSARLQAVMAIYYDYVRIMNSSVADAWTSSQ
jgi:hypothetical protein